MTQTAQKTSIDILPAKNIPHISCTFDSLFAMSDMECRKCFEAILFFVSWYFAIEISISNIFYQHFPDF